MNSQITAKEFNIKGVVQGVGFRPFIFQLAHHYGLKGEVFNTSKGVTVIVETSSDNLNNIERFKIDITDKKPPLSIISEINSQSIAPSHYKDFVISKSTKFSPLYETSKNSSDGYYDSSDICWSNSNIGSPKSCLSNSPQVTLISPDVSVCDDCIKEMQDPNDRRFGYPFINCTNCGPRYTIIKDIPYDRPKTSMSVFKMCKECQKEYDDPFNRRFHAQPNACPTCGPHLFIVDKFGKVVLDDKLKRVIPADDKIIKNTNYNGNISNGLCSISSLEYAAMLLKEGKIVAIKGLGGFHLAVDAMNPNAVAELRRRKKRPHKPFALMAKSVDAASELVFISSDERQILESHHRPIVLLAKKKGVVYDKVGNNDRCSLRYIAPNNQFLGIMLPYTPLHYFLLEKGPSILVMTSGNRSGEPLSIDNEDAMDAFSNIADYFLLHNRDIYFRADDSIVQVQNQVPRFFRRSRGYAPLPIILPNYIIVFQINKSAVPIAPPPPPSPIERGNNHSLPLGRVGEGQNNYLESYKYNSNSDNYDYILGCGAGLKNTLCLTSGNFAFLSQHIGDLENEKVFNFYTNSINHLKKIFNIEPTVVAYDLHPDYLSSKFARSLKEQSNICQKVHKKDEDNSSIIFVPVQHHHAHAVSCMAENGIQGDVIAITLDGTGLGADGNIWGGEVFVCNEKNFERKAHIKYLPMPGGDAATKEPWRMAVSYLYAAFGDDMFLLEIPFIKEFLNNGKAQSSSNKIAFIVQMIKKKINTPLTSSCGRLFDAVASLCSIRHEITFESQAAIELQGKSIFIENENSERYEIAIHKNSDNKILDTINSQPLLIIDFIPCIKNIVEDISNRVSIEEIAAKFHQTIIESFVIAAKKVSVETGIKRVVLSGGVFNNLIILNGMIHFLEKDGFQVYSHSKVPSGDGGISLGQVVVARMQMLQEGKTITH
ncbi:MAG: carbamoyltransferase HypF [Desulfamplus sp.]|nr:carbamoyltransferase HypF [Desulfamplus sp.]